MFGVLGISFQCIKLSKFSLSIIAYHVNVKAGKRRRQIGLASMAGSQGSEDGGGIPQSSSPGIAGGFRRCRIRVTSSVAGVAGVSSCAGLDPDASPFSFVRSSTTCPRGLI